LHHWFSCFVSYFNLNRHILFDAAAGEPSPISTIRGTFPSIT